MNKDKIERFDSVFFKNLNQEEKEKYFINYIRKTLGIMEKGGDRHGN